MGRRDRGPMNTVVILIGPGQLAELIDDLQLARTSPDTRTIALVLSSQAVAVRNATLTFPPQARLYVGPIQTLGFTGSLQDIQGQLDGLDEVN